MVALAMVFVCVLAPLVEPALVVLRSPAACPTLARFESGNTNLSRPCALGRLKP